MSKKSRVNLLPTIAIVKKLLTDHYTVRDSDVRLCALIWHEEKGGEENAKQFLADFYFGKFTSPEAITRVRRKLQEKHPELRGASYVERQRKQAKVKAELREVKRWN